MKVKVKRHPDYPDAVLPIKAHPSDAGADLTVAKVEYGIIKSRHLLLSNQVRMP